MIDVPIVLLPDSSCTAVDDCELEQNVPRFELYLHMTSLTSPCPLCQQSAHRVHSRYQRKLADLPWAGIPVRIYLGTRRYFCDNPGCKRRTFAERIPTVAAPWARRTQRLATSQQQIGLLLGGAAGAKLSEQLAMTAGIDLILTLIRDATPPDRPTPKALGIDDWAWRKGQTYGTILVDLEEGAIVDLLPDRNAETVAQWLREHPGVEIITRDRSTIYADGATQGAPDAVQVADRWHLLQNATAALLKVFQHHQNEIEPLLKETQVVTNSGEEPTQTVEQKPLLPDIPPLAPHQEASRLRRQAQVEEAQQLRRQGWTMRAIAAHLDVTSKTVRRYLNLPLPVPPQRRIRRQKIAAFKPYLLQRWNEGCHNATQLFREIQAKGYSGQATMVRLYIAQLRQSSGLPPRKRNSSGTVLTHDPTIRLPTMRTLSWHVTRRPDTLSANEAAWVDAARNAHPHVQIAIELVQGFARLIRRQPTTDTFDSWLEIVLTCPLAALRNFAKGLRDDYSAVKAALETDWNNGPTEGHVNRLKLVKRQMFGRAHFDLLRQRLLAA